MCLSLNCSIRLPLNTRPPGTFTVPYLPKRNLVQSTTIRARKSEPHRNTVHRRVRSVSESVNDRRASRHGNSSSAKSRILRISLSPLDGAKRPATTGLKRPATFGSKRPATPGSKRPASCGSKRPTTSGSKRPAKPGSKRHSTHGSKRLATPGSKRLATSGSKRPATSGSKRHVTPGSKHPASPGSKRPASSGSKRLATSGSKRPATSGSKRPGKGGDKIKKRALLTAGSSSAASLSSLVAGCSTGGPSRAIEEPWYIVSSLKRKSDDSCSTDSQPSPPNGKTRDIRTRLTGWSPLKRKFDWDSPCKVAARKKATVNVSLSRFDPSILDDGVYYCKDRLPKHQNKRSTDKQKR